MNLESPILLECKKLISRHQHRAAQAHQIRERFRKATGESPGSSKKTRRQAQPPHWNISTFNPYRVRKRATRTAAAIEAKLAALNYKPRPALIHQLPKPDGGVRQVSVFPVADSAVASYFYRRILRRNQARLSPNSYAYRFDIGLHDAVEHLWRESGEKKQFWAVEFDFSKYFDTISHEYLLRVVRRYFRITHVERQVLESFLRCERAFSQKAYENGGFRQSVRGIPQGNSLSLFLANAACHELDLKLARGRFVHARYADDIIVLCRTEADAGEARELILGHCDDAGLSINFDKSSGVSSFGPEGLAATRARKGNARTEVPVTVRAAFDYVGHTFGYRLVHRKSNPASEVVRRLSIRERGARRVRIKLSNIIYSHLLRYPRKGLFSRSRVNTAIGIDWDLVTCINDLRGYLYGGLSEDEIGTKSGPIHQPSGVLAFYPLVNDVEQLKSLDGWLLHALASAVEKRQRILRTNFRVHYPVLTVADLASRTWYDADRAGIRNDVTVPSFVRAWKYSRRCLSAFNLKQLPSRQQDDDGLYD